MKVDRRALLRAFRFDGWLDRQTGEIIECEKELAEDGAYHYIIPENMRENKERYPRIPYLDYVQFALDIVDAGLIPKELLNRYGAHKIDYRNDGHLLFAPYDKPRGFETTQEGDDLYGAIDEIADNDADIARVLSNWARTVFWEYIERWIKEMGCEL